MANLTAGGGFGLAAGAAAAKVRKGLDRTTKVLAVAAGTVVASISELNSCGLDSQLFSRISSAAATATCGIGEGGALPISRAAGDAPWLEWILANADHQRDGLIAAAQTPEFWQRTLGNAMEASACAAAIAAVDQLLVHRDALLNDSAEDRQELLLQILQASGLMAAGALPASMFLVVALMLVPGLAMVMGPLGVIGSAGLGLRLISSIVRHPSRQERRALQQLQGLLQEWIYALQRDSDGHLTITVQAQPAN